MLKKTLKKLLIIFPFSPFIYGFLFASTNCIFKVEEFSCHNIIGITLIAPFALIFGPITHDADPPESLWPKVLLTATAIALLWEILCFWRKKRALGKSGQAIAINLPDKK